MGRATGETRVDTRRRDARERGRVVSGGQQTSESALGATAEARPTTRRFQSIPSDPYAMEAGISRLRGRPHRMLHTRVVLDRAADWTRLGVRMTRSRQPRRQQQDWRTCTASWGEGETSTNTMCSQGCQEWFASPLVSHWTKSAGTIPPRMFCLLSRAANVRAVAHASGRVRACVCARACVGSVYSFY